MTLASPPSTAKVGTITLNTNCGAIVVKTDPRAPRAVASEAFLADAGFYDNSVCHRLSSSTVFALQCGDPSGNGSGNAGYALDVENAPRDQQGNYPAGTVALSALGEGSVGSQFFIVYRDSTLSPNYTVWGHVVEGLDIVRRNAAQGTVESGVQPAASLQILSVTTSP